VLRLAPYITLAVFLAPVVAGLAGTLAPAFGYLPALGGEAVTLAPWRVLFDWPGLPRSLIATVFVGFAATALSLWIAVEIAARINLHRLAQRALPPLLATPHAALAIGFAFLIAPSGWIVRWLSPWATGFDTPPDVALVQDPWGLAMTGGLVLKEVPYLSLMLFAALGQVRLTETLAVARSLGYGPRAAWYRLVLPQLYPRLRLPVYAVLAFSLSAVDVALILGPTNPPLLGVQILRWLASPQLADWFPGAAAAMLQAMIVIAGIVVWRGLESAGAAFGLVIIQRGQRPWHFGGLGWPLGALIALCAGAALLLLALWSVAGPWRFPDALPASFTAETWMRHGVALLGPFGTTLALAAATAFTSLLLAVACLENERRHGLRPGNRVLWLLYGPLLIPQLGFLFGLQSLLVRAGLDGSWLALALAHLVFVLPYTFLALTDPWRGLDPRFARSAAGLGASRQRTFWLVVVPLMTRPLLAAFATGFAVSSGLYLPTLFAGGGRIATLTTEAVTLAAGGDRRVLGAFALLQALLPMLVYAVALLLPAWLFRHRAALRVAR
jgi:putative thiamine transport system permease protein